MGKWIKEKKRKISRLFLLVGGTLCIFAFIGIFWGEKRVILWGLKGEEKKEWQVFIQDLIEKEKGIPSRDIEEFIRLDPRVGRARVFSVGRFYFVEILPKRGWFLVHRGEKIEQWGEDGKIWDEDFLGSSDFLKKKPIFYLTLQSSPKKRDIIQIMQEVEEKSPSISEIKIEAEGGYRIFLEGSWGEIFLPFLSPRKLRQVEALSFFLRKYFSFQKVRVFFRGDQAFLEVF